MIENRACRSGGILCRFLIKILRSILILGIVFLERVASTRLVLVNIPFAPSQLPTLLRLTVLGIMYQPASFSVAPQHAHHDENTGYNTRPSFVIPGSKAAERNARHKKGSISVLQTVPNRHWGVLSCRVGTQSIAGTESIGLECKCRGVGNTRIKLELIALSLLGNDTGCCLNGMLDFRS